MSSCTFCTGHNSEVSLAPLKCFSCSLARLCLYQLRSGFSGEGKHISVMGSSGCLPWAEGICLETIPVFHPPSLVVGT